MVNDIYRLIVEKMKSYPDILFGIADISYSEFYEHYNRALVFAISHGQTICLKNYTEAGFEKQLDLANKQVYKITADFSDLFQTNKIQYLVPQFMQTNEETLLAPFSFKYAAVQAGLGWIGKNGVLITKEYGPRVKLLAVLVNADLPVGSPVTESKCAQECNLCKEACPYNAIKGVKWNRETHREELIDYQLCNQKRSRYLKWYHRKHSCGLCMAACPWGLNEFVKR